MKNNRLIFMNIAYIGALIALQVVLGNLVQIAMLTKQMNLGFLPIAVAGYLFGPVGGLLVAALGDVIGTLLFGTGAYFPGFTVTAALVGIVYGWILFPKYHRWVRGFCISRIGRLLTRALFASFGGLLVAVLIYWIGTLLFRTDAYLPWITIAGALVGIVYGWILFTRYQQMGELLIRATIASVAVAVIYILLNSYWLTFFIGKGYWVILLGRLPFYLIEVPIFTALITICCSQMKRLPRLLLPDEIRKNIDGKP